MFPQFIAVAFPTFQGRFLGYRVQGFLDDFHALLGALINLRHGEVGPVTAFSSPHQAEFFHGVVVAGLQVPHLLSRAKNPFSCQFFPDQRDDNALQVGRFFVEVEDGGNQIGCAKLPLDEIQRGLGPFFHRNKFLASGRETTHDFHGFHRILPDFFTF